MGGSIRKIIPCQCVDNPTEAVSSGPQACLRGHLG